MKVLAPISKFWKPQGSHTPSIDFCKTYELTLLIVVRDIFDFGRISFINQSQWFSGKIRACHARAPCSIHGCDNLLLLFPPSYSLLSLASKGKRRLSFWNSISTPILIASKR
jgi:hypothetical protein